LGEDEKAEIDEGLLLEEFVEASRQAESFREAMQLALGKLREALRSESALLLERVGEEGYRCRTRVPLEGDRECYVPLDGVLLGRLRNFAFPLRLTAGDFETWSRWAAAHKPQHLPEIASLSKSGAAMAVALRAKNEIIGILLLGDALGRREYSDGDKRVMAHCGAQFALLLENARLTDRIVAQEKINRDVLLAVEVQKRLFPDTPPASTTVALAGISLPARSVGGDYYDFFDLGGERIGIALADVAGKGVAAALIMSVVQASLRVLVTEQRISMSELAAKMNRFLHRSTRSSGYATFFYAQIDERKRELRYVNAGHNPPYLLRYVADQSIEELPAGGTVIGLFPQSSYEETTVELRPGDVLIAFTDGVPEALNEDEEEFGEDRLKGLLRRCAHLGVDEIASEIAAELKAWIGDAAQYDDLTFVLVKVKEEERLCAAA
jgi:sigma-B regulation protein RsbU (phosphoserine phosphatase)